MGRFKFVSAVHLFLFWDEKILLLRRANTGCEDGNYSVSVGCLDGKESVTRAMAREALEEEIQLYPDILSIQHTCCIIHQNDDLGTIVSFIKNYSTERQVLNRNRKFYLMECMRCEHGTYLKLLDQSG